MQEAAEEGLAQVEVETHSGFVDENTTAVTSAEAMFSYTYGGVTREITIPENTTLSGLRDLINNDESNPGITAAVLDDGSGLSTAYHLQLVGSDSGAMFQIENINHTLDNFATGGSTGYGFNETQKAQNAMLQVDGYPSDVDEYIQRKSNSIGDLVSGVTLNLAGAGTATVSIVNDSAAIKTKIEDFVDAVNGVLDYVKAMMARVAAGDQEYTGPMIGNYGFQIVQRNINTILSGPVPGLAAETDTYTHLSQIGIRTDDDTVTWTSNEESFSISARRWTIDATALENALTADIEAVSALFVNDTVRGISGIAELVREETENFTPSYNDINPGIVSVLINNYEGIIDNIDDKISREERRLALVENRLNIRYSQLEALLQQYRGQTSMLTAMIDAMTKSKDD
jgi:flagellar hook-associated protein 2